jgi:hypothetical protein
LHSLRIALYFRLYQKSPADTPGTGDRAGGIDGLPDRCPEIARTILNP